MFRSHENIWHLPRVTNGIALLVGRPSLICFLTSFRTSRRHDRGVPRRKSTQETYYLPYVHDPDTPSSFGGMCGDHIVFVLSVVQAVLYLRIPWRIYLSLFMCSLCKLGHSRTSMAVSLFVVASLDSFDFCFWTDRFVARYLGQIPALQKVEQ